MRTPILSLLALMMLLVWGCSDSGSDKGVAILHGSITTPASDVTILAGGTVDFQAAATGGEPPLAYSWDFDGGAASVMAQDPGVTAFPAPGMYLVTFTVTDNAGTDVTDTVTVTVKSLLADIAAPSGNVTVYQSESVDFQATVTGGTGPFTHAWDFDGGASNVTVEDPGLVAFNTIGVYTVTYTVTDSIPKSDTDTVTVTVLKALVSIDITPATADLMQGATLDFIVMATYSDTSTGNVTTGASYASADETAITMNGHTATALPSGPIRPVTITASYTLGTTTVPDTAVITTTPGVGYTKAAIKAQWNLLKPVNTIISYSSNPVMTVNDSGYEGRIDTQSVTDGLNMLNFYRWLAGLPSGVTDNATYAARCQKGAHVLVMLEALSQSYSSPHDPPLPTGSTSNYQTNIFGGPEPATTINNTGGWIACAKSNIFRGWGGSAYTADECIHGWMDDFGNLTTLGHRRWILHPRLNTSAFGSVWYNLKWASLLYVFDTTAATPTYDFVAFPSPGYFPKQCFADPADAERVRWSFSANSAEYDLDGSTYVTVVRQSDSHNFTITTTIMPANYGITPTISFNPNESTLDETYQVTVHDILKYGPPDTRIDYSYWVGFFDVTL
ncbi:MAG: PKD domain-containing protein [Planctomycetota bacterium]